MAHKYMYVESPRELSPKERRSKISTSCTKIPGHKTDWNKTAARISPAGSAAPGGRTDRSHPAGRSGHSVMSANDPRQRKNKSD